MVIFRGVAPLAHPADLTITLGDEKAEVAFAGLIGNGLFQFNIVVPPVPEGFNRLIANMGDSSTLHAVFVSPPGPPVITAMTPADFVWGQDTTVMLSGSGISGPNRIEFSDPNQLTPQLEPHEGQYFRMNVEENAVPGQRTVTVTNRKGQSNAFPFTIRRGEPRITSLTPSTVWPGRAYSFTVEGSDMAGVKGMEVSPATGVRASFGLLQLDSDVSPGTLQMRLKAPGTLSPPVPLEVVPAPTNAPSIGSLSPIAVSPYNAMIPGAFSRRADYTGELEFTDADGDIKSGSRIEMLAELNGSSIASSTGKLELGSKPGKARFTFTHFARNVSPGPFTVWITLYDEAGNRSNALKGTVTAWYF